MKTVRIRLGERDFEATCEPRGGGPLADGVLRVRVDGGEPVEVRLVPVAPGEWKALLGARGESRRVIALPPARGGGWLVVDGAAYEIAPSGPARRAGGGGAAGDSAAPMPGTLRKVLVKAGDRVEKGQKVALLEAMKMEIPVAAAHAGTVEAVLIEPGKPVDAGQEIVRIRGDRP